MHSQLFPDASTVAEPAAHVLAEGKKSGQRPAQGRPVMGVLSVCCVENDGVVRQHRKFF